VAQATLASLAWLSDGAVPRRTAPGDPYNLPRGIFGSDGHLVPTGPASKGRVGNYVCFSGAFTQEPKCGTIVGREREAADAEGVASGGFWVEFSDPARPGDSGSPVWNPRTGASIGLVTAVREYRDQTLVEPLLHPPNMNANHLPGILHSPKVGPLLMTTGG
jgi:hypothetical protein